MDDKNTPNPDRLYDYLSKSFANTLDRAGKGNREDGNQRRRQITLHSFRRFVKTTISDLGYVDFSGMVYRTFWFYILNKKRFRESRDISQD